MEVIKRDGRKEQFDEKKIIKAISKCYIANEEFPDETQINEIVSIIKNINKDLTVEEIQDLIIENLDDLTIANSYKEYREKRSRIRDSNINKLYYDTILELVKGEQNDTSKENSNKNAKQINVMRDLIAGETCKKLYKETQLPKELAELHSKGVIHYHDMDYRLMQGITNCGLLNLKDALENGTVINGKLIEKPNSLKTAITIATQIICAVGSSQYGGQTITMSHLAPFVVASRNRIKNLLERANSYSKELEEVLLNQEIKDSIQTLHYQLNTLSTTNGQSPFITIFCYVDEIPEYREETSLLTAELFRQRLAGMKSPSGHTINPTFPKVVYVLTNNNLNENHPDFELTKLAAKCTCKRMVPDYMSEKKAKEYKNGCVIPPMGCRSFLSPWKNENGEYQIYGRANTGVISINLPYIALDSSNIQEFKDKLSNIIHIISKEQYRIYNIISKTSVEVAPILWQYGVYGRAKSGNIGQFLDNMKCSVSIGYMGLAEAVERFGIHYTSKEGHDLGIDIIKFMFEEATKNKEFYNISLGLYGTPAESLTTKFANAIKTFPIIKNVNDRDYITNSYHVPVTEKVDGFTKIDFESEFQKYSHNGAISYIELPDVSKNPEAVIEILKHIYDKMMYCELNTSSCSICYNCGFEGQIDIASDGSHCTCPNCGNTDPNKMYVVYRTCGYLGSFEQGTTKGRAQDIINRVKHF